MSRRTKMKLRAPATPIINIDPYFSIWVEDSVLKNTIHWSGAPNTMCGRVFIDGKEYHFFGKNDKTKEIPNMTLEETEIEAYSTRYVFSNNEIRLNVCFTSPLLIKDLYYASRPVAYCKVSYESKDGNLHNVKVKFLATEELVLNKKGEGRALAEKTEIKGITAIKMGRGNGKVLNRCGDDVRIDWGHLYLCAKGEAETDISVFENMYAISIEKEIESCGLFLFAYDDIESIVYFGENLKAYWKKDGKTIEEAIIEAAEDYEEIYNRCSEFSKELKEIAEDKGGEKYAEILLLAVRQVMGAHKLVVDKDGNNLYISKECHSNGCAATVDITYPSSPLYLLYNTELLKGMIRPVMKYALSEEWTPDFAPHDVGIYPFVNGQDYAVHRYKDGSVEEIVMHGQMPVEESGNMMILFANICEKENDYSFAKEYIDTLDVWCKYLIDFGIDPADQLCTDDFAGHLAHNVNLSIKAIMGIAAYSKILAALGEENRAEKYMKTVIEYAKSMLERAKNLDGSYRLTYDKEGTFSLKYNAVWDRVWKTGIFPEEFFAGEIKRYLKEMLPYGVPLDSRDTITKSDWLVWAAALAKDKADFIKITDSLWSAYNTMRTRVPMTDMYYAETSLFKWFRHRSVQGALFIKLLID